MFHKLEMNGLVSADLCTNSGLFVDPGNFDSNALRIQFGRGYKEIMRHANVGYICLVKLEVESAKDGGKDEVKFAMGQA
jgi:hypothetical protein